MVTLSDSFSQNKHNAAFCFSIGYKICSRSTESVSLVQILPNVVLHVPLDVSIAGKWAAAFIKRKRFHSRHVRFDFQRPFENLRFCEVTWFMSVEVFVLLSGDQRGFYEMQTFFSASKVWLQSHRRVHLSLGDFYTVFCRDAMLYY